MIHYYVFDTVGFINYHCDFFNEPSRLSRKVISDVEKCLSSDFFEYKLIIPSIVFVEIFEKKLRNDELAAKFKSEILTMYLDADDVEIKGLEKEVIEVYNNIDNNIIKLETHDKIIIASAIQMKGKLISNDGKLTTYANATQSVELVF
jgi:predicted nucleic acid-binding protein